MKKDTYIFNAIINNVVDGDTVDAIVDLGFYVNYNTRLRLYGINTPELHATDPAVRAKALEAKNYVISKLPVGTAVTLQTFGQEKYGRFLAKVFISDYNLNDDLVAQGLASIYFGSGPKT
jgi:micrococcal nuclease